MSSLRQMEFIVWGARVAAATRRGIASYTGNEKWSLTPNAPALGQAHFFDRKQRKTNGIVAIRSVGHKLARAAYYMLRDQVPFDEQKLFA